MLSIKESRPVALFEVEKYFDGNGLSHFYNVPAQTSKMCCRWALGLFCADDTRPWMMGPQPDEIRSGYERFVHKVDQLETSANCESYVFVASGRGGPRFEAFCHCG
jgi:hypothetical protein